MADEILTISTINELFDPENPLNYSKINSSTNLSKGLRFKLLRELITSKPCERLGDYEHEEISAQESETSCDRWEQMISQLSYNASKLLSISGNLTDDYNLYIKANTRWSESEKRWENYSESSCDLLFFESEDDSQELIKINEVKINDEIIYHAYIAKTGSLYYYSRNTRKMNNPVVVVKIGFPTHYTMALVYINEERIEFFDSGGTLDIVGYRDQEGNIPYSKSQETRGKLRTSNTCYIPSDPRHYTDYAVCQTLGSIFNSYDYVGINSIDLQTDDKDAYCQTWILLYVYIKFIYPRHSTLNTINFLQSLNSNELLELIETFWSYLVYLDIDTIDLDTLALKRKIILESGQNGGFNINRHYSSKPIFYKWLLKYYKDLE